MNISSRKTHFFKDVSFHVSFHVKSGYMGCFDFSINNLQNTCLVTWLLTQNITFRVKYFIKKSSVLRLKNNSSLLFNLYHYLTVALSCGGSASENQTYLVQSSVTTLTSPCTYTICPCSSNICRIRFDFTVRILTGPKRLYHKWQIKTDAEKTLLY